MLKRSVQMICAVVLMAGSALVATSSPASALNYFVHGNVQCEVVGTTRYAPALRSDVAQNTRAIIKGTLQNCTDGHGNPGGETGISGVSITGGKFRVISNYFSGDCSHIAPPDITMKIRWYSNTGVRIRNTDVSWSAPVAVGAEPYNYAFAGGTTNIFGAAGSYFGATGAVNFQSFDPFSSSGIFASLACPTGARLKIKWPFGADGQSKLTFLSPPTVSNVSPNAATLGTSNLNVDVTGMDFTSDDTVSFSGSGITVNSTTYVSPTQLTANISIAPGALAGMRDVSVANSTLGSGVCTSCFMVAPTVTSVAPGTVAQGAANKNITITGQGFANGAYTEVSGTGVFVNTTQYVSPTQLIVNVVVTTGASLGARDVTVVDPGFGVGSCTGCLTVTAGPTVTSTTPASRGVGATNTVVAVNGTNFSSGATVAFSGTGITVNSTTYVSPTQLNANISIAGNAATGIRAVSVTNTDGGFGTCAACFTVNSGPAISDWQVVSDGYYFFEWHEHEGHYENRQMYGGLTVQIVGTNFQPGATVSYSSGDITLNSTTYVSSTKIKMNITIDVVDFALHGLPQDRAITVTNPDGGTYTCQGCVVLIV